MEQEDLTEDSAEAAAVKKAKSTSATAEGQEPKTPGDEEEWKTAGRTKKTQIPTLPKMEKIPLPGKYYHVQCRGTVGQRDETIKILGATQSTELKGVRWCATLGTPEYESHRSFAILLENCPLVDTAARAHKEHKWVMSAFPEVGLPARFKLDECGQLPSSWGARGAPAAPEERRYGAALRGQANRAEDVRNAWRTQFPTLPKQTEQQPQEMQEMHARMKTMEDMLKELKELVAQGQPSAPAAATPATQDSELMQRIQDLEEDKVKMAEQLAEVRALVEKQDQVAATQKARYDRSSRLLAEASLEDKETMWKQQMEIRELQAKLQQQQEQSVVVDVATQIVHETTPSAEISEATQQQPVTRWDPNMFHTPSKEERTEERQKMVEEVLRSLGRSPKEQKKNSRNKATRLRQRDLAGRVRLAGAETAVAPVASLFQSEEEKEDWLPALPVESLGGEAEPVGSKRMSDREPGLDGTPEWKGSRLMRSEVYAPAAADIGLQVRLWQSPQRFGASAAALSDPYRPDPKSDSDCDSEGNSD